MDIERMLIIDKLLIILNILNFFDLIVTITGINKFGLVAEANQLIVFVIFNFGFIPVILLKIGFVLFGSLILKNSYEKTDFKFIRYISVFVILFIIICYVKIIVDWMCVLIG